MIPGFLLALLFFVVSIPGYTAVAFVSAAAGSTTGGGATQASSTAQTHTAGNLLYVSAAFRNASVGCGSITLSVADADGNTFTQIGSAWSSTHMCQYHWYAKNIGGQADNVVTVTCSATCDVPGITVLEFSGLDTTTPLDNSSSGDNCNNCSSLTGTSFTTSADLFVAGAYVYNPAGGLPDHDAGNFQGRSSFTGYSSKVGDLLNENSYPDPCLILVHC